MASHVEYGVVLGQDSTVENVRAIGNGMRVGIVQFVKGKWSTGERHVFEKFPEQVEIRTMGEGFTWETQDRERDIELAQAAWAEAKKHIIDPQVKMVLLDEINLNLSLGKTPYDSVLDSAASRLRPVALAAATTVLGVIPLLPDVFWVSMSVVSDGSYEVAEGLISSFPCTCSGGEYTIVQGLEMLLQDPDGARVMGSAGRRFVEDVFTWPRVVERFRQGFDR